jgi:hypothetical protein
LGNRTQRLLRRLSQPMLHWNEPTVCQGGGGLAVVWAAIDGYRNGESWLALAFVSGRTGPSTFHQRELRTATNTKVPPAKPTISREGKADANVKVPRTIPELADCRTPAPSCSNPRIARTARRRAGEHPKDGNLVFRSTATLLGCKPVCECTARSARASLRHQPQPGFSFPRGLRSVTEVNA